MKYLVVIVAFSCFYSTAFTQKLGPEDTLLHTNRTFGNAQSLMHVMDGFSSSFFFQAQQSYPNPIELFQPGFTSFATANKTKKPLLFSALPHLGFGYGFGAQGSQILRLDYEQAFNHRTLLNVRYDRWQRIGFIRADELRFSGLQIHLHQKGKAHEIQLAFDNVSDDRQWSGGITDYSQLNTIELDLIPVIKEQSNTQKNSYRGTVDLRYRIFGDSIRRLNLASFHAYNLQRRVYNEVGSLALYYPQTYINVDTCADTFRQVHLENRVGLNWSAPKFVVTSLIGVRSRQWSDEFLTYDTLELNLKNYFTLWHNAHHIQHDNEINMIGAGQGVNFNTLYTHAPKASKFNFSIKHSFRHEWPELMQRTYLSNLTQYFWNNPQKEKIQQLEAGFAYIFKPLSVSLSLSLVDFESVYRFNPSIMSWSSTSLISKGQLATLGTKMKYSFGPFNLSSSYQYFAQNKDQFLPKHQAAMSLLWAGGVFKDKRLKMTIETQVNYQSSFKGLFYLPFIESLDWYAIQNSSVQKGFYNAQLNLALEVKTFRFFLNVANIGSYWNRPQIAIIQGYTFAPMQIRIGLSWDFWN